MFVAAVVLTNSSKHLMLVNLSVRAMQVILSFVIPLLILLPNLLVNVSQLNLFVNLLMRTGNVLLCILIGEVCKENSDSPFLFT